MAELDYLMMVQPLSQDDGGGYVAYAPDLRGCTGDGETPEEAISDLRSAIKEWLDEARRQGNEIPEPGCVVARAVQERKSLLDLVSNQKSLISELDAGLKEQSKRIDDIRARVDSFQSQLEEIRDAACEDLERGPWSTMAASASQRVVAH